MIEVKLLKPVKAKRDARLAEGSWEPGVMKTFAPGAFAVCMAGKPARKGLRYVCPCGCGSIGWLPVLAKGDPATPKDGPRWDWDGDTTAPTLSPSVHHVGHWHGYLRAGVWVQA